MVVDLDKLRATFFEEAAELLTDMEASLLALESSGGDRAAIDPIFRAAHSIKGGCGLFGFTEIRDLAHALEGLLDLLRAGKLTATRPTVDLLLVGRDALQGLVDTRRAGDVGAADPELLGQNTLITETSAALGETSVESVGAAIQTDSFGLFEPPAAPAKAAPVRHVEGSSIRVSVDKVDRMMNLVGELVIAQSMLSEVVDGFTPQKLELLRGAVAELQRQTRELQQHVMSVRMVPVGTIFSRYPRVVRDLASACGKEVELNIEGEDTELDKSIVERIADPLTHLVRNGIDHGLESTEQRIQAHKSPTGTLRLAARHESGCVVVEVADDGRGLDLDRIRQKAVDRGLLAADATPTDDQLTSLIFEPGFSTAEKLSDVSGRGVGMDVVKRSVEELGGVINLQTSPGAGTTVRIRLPLTLAILDGQYVEVGGRVFVVPVLSIVESLRIDPSSVTTVLAQGELVRVRDETLPLVRLVEVLGLGRAQRAERVLVVVVESDGCRLALQVDALLGQSQVVIKNLERHYQRVDGFMGATIMGNGGVALILDVQSILKLTHKRGPRGLEAA